MNKKELVKNALLRKKVPKFPIFMTATPQFMKRCTDYIKEGSLAIKSWQYCFDKDLDVVQVGHPSFYPVNLDLPRNSKYTDDWGRTHLILDYYDDFTAPFPLQKTRRVDATEIKNNWETYEFPDPKDQKWFDDVEKIIKHNKQLDDPLSIWGVINGPFEPTWQLMSDGWPAYFMLARKEPELAKEIINRIAEYSITAGVGLIERGVDVIRIGDDYAHNDGLLCRPKTWLEFLYPAHKRLIEGLKKAAGGEFPVILHSDGDITEIFPWLKKSGIDALNPIQPDALEVDEVTNAVGSHLALTGAFDLRYFLDPITDETCRKIDGEINRLFSIFQRYNEAHTGSDRTGFCIGPTHQVQPTSHVETFEYWIQQLHRYNEHIDSV
ncbi:MAG: hypothetical protein GF364_09320 [Candidatus Lokiarchaeota archaeon]|nr:hypothetical protein [Candidatus Lokiarchaeota archaeon]